MIDGWPVRIDQSLEAFMKSAGWRVLRRFGERADSRTLIVAVEIDGASFIVKHAADPEAVGWLQSAIRFHAAVAHEAIPTVVHHVTTPDGLALIEEWGSGDILADGYDAAVLPPEHPGSTHRKFLDLPAGQIALAIDQLIDAHIAVADAGFVAVDLYDGCVLYDFERGRLSLIDLDHYCPGPYVLDADRQLGSSSYMPPEEFTRGATVDERATVFTLGRTAHVYLGCARKSAASRSDFRGTDEQFEVAVEATRAGPDERIPTVRALHRAWRDTL